MSVFLKKLRAVRGAVCCRNNVESIKSETVFLFSEIIKVNKILEKDIVSIHFSITQDLNELNPASALRKGGFAKHIPLFCSLEPAVKNGLPETIRILVHYYSRRKAKPVYIHGAEILRPDIL